MPIAIVGRLQRVDRIDRVTSGDQGRDTRTSICLDADHHGIGFGAGVEVFADQGVQAHGAHPPAATSSESAVPVGPLHIIRRGITSNWTGLCCGAGG